MKLWLGRVGLAIAVVLAGIYGYLTLRGPQGVPALFEKQRTIRELQEHNANLAREVQERKERIQRLKESQSEQEMEIRKRLKLVRPGETSFILPDASGGQKPGGGSEGPAPKN